MAARVNKINHTQDVRDRIRSSQLINFLQDHVFNGTEVKKTQVSAAVALLRKTLPDLQSVEGNLSHTVRTHEEQLKDLE